MMPKANKLEFIEIKSQTLKRMKRQDRMGKNIHKAISEKTLVSRIYKGKKLTTGKEANFFYNW